jgi:hypothetical protein
MKQDAFHHFVHYSSCVVPLVPPTSMLLFLDFSVFLSFALQQGGPPTFFHKSLLFNKAFFHWFKHSLFSRDKGSKDPNYTRPKDYFVLCWKGCTLATIKITLRREELMRLSLVNMYYICSFLFCTLSLSLLGDLV